MWRRASYVGMSQLAVNLGVDRLARIMHERILRVPEKPREWHATVRAVLLANGGAAVASGSYVDIRASSESSMEGRAR
jgi:hypothetical protein